MPWYPREPRPLVNTCTSTNTLKFGSTLVPGVIPLERMISSSVRLRSREIYYRLDPNLDGPGNSSPRAGHKGEGRARRRIRSMYVRALGTFILILTIIRDVIYVICNIYDELPGTSRFDTTVAVMEKSLELHVYWACVSLKLFISFASGRISHLTRIQG